MSDKLARMQAQAEAKRDAAPALYSALRLISAASCDPDGNPVPVLLTEAQREQIAHALSLAEGLI